MSRLLLDTHIFVWFAAGDSRVGESTREVIGRAADSGELYLSAISAWEIAMLVAKGRLALTQDVGDWVTEALSKLGIKLLPLTADIAVASTRLPGTHHGDPADRIIAASARSLGATLITVDQKLLEYASAGHVRARDGAL